MQQINEQRVLYWIRPIVRARHSINEDLVLVSTSTSRGKECQWRGQRQSTNLSSFYSSELMGKGVLSGRLTNGSFPNRCFGLQYAREIHNFHKNWQVAPESKCLG